MAATTVSSPIRQVDTGVYTMWGYLIPQNILHVEIGNDLYGERMVSWIAKGDPKVHRMDFPDPTEENILAVLAAMRLSV